MCRLIRKEARIKMLERKIDTRRKIQLGGLVKKAGLHEMPTATLFGLLLEAAELLQSENGEEVKNRWRVKGDIVLTMAERN